VNRDQVRAAVVTWWEHQAPEEHRAPEGGKVEAFNQGHRGRGWRNTWDVYLSDAGDNVVAHHFVQAYGRAGQVTIYTHTGGVLLGTVDVQPAAGAGIRLSQTAPWNPALRNPYRTRYAEQAGRYFTVRADYLTAPWFVWEIDRDGTDVGPVGGGVAMNLTQARAMIAAALADTPDKNPES
jgi:hypothetical protein